MKGKIQKLEDLRRLKLSGIQNNSEISSDKQIQTYLEFLYKSLPLHDISTYDETFFIDHCKQVISSLQTFSKWTTLLSLPMILHYILPPRVNTEPLKPYFRSFFYSKFKDQIIEHSQDSQTCILYLNHLSHEHVTYTPSDNRTRSALQTWQNQLGRCGEESVLFVDMCRAAGIPARQVYTPRWAHQDDNHAWVEVYIAEKQQWFFLGACEPAPLLNSAWFNLSASRAMLIHSKIIGDYHLMDNEVLIQPFNGTFTEVNVLETYTGKEKLKQIKITVIDKETGNIEVNCLVKLMVYNMATFFCCWKKETDNNGEAEFVTAKGSVLIWAVSKDKTKYAFGHLEADQNQMKLFLDYPFMHEMSIDYTFYPPQPNEAKLVKIDEQMQIENQKLLVKEDEIRISYEKNNFASEEMFNSLCQDYNLQFPENLRLQFFEIMKKARSNWKNLMNFIHQCSQKLNLEFSFMLQLLQTLSQKDLEDANAEVLLDHIRIANDVILFDDREMFIKYVMNPRIDYEQLSKFRLFFQETQEWNFLSSCKNDIEGKLIPWIKSTFQVNNDYNYYWVPLTPKSVHECKLSDKNSLKIYFVALCRTLQIPSRIEEGSRIPQIYVNKKWIDIELFESEQVGVETQQQQQQNQRVKISFSNATPNKQLKYFVHVSLAQFNGLGEFLDLGYEDDKDIEELKNCEILKGQYLLVCGNRLSHDKILINMKFLTIQEDQIISCQLREEKSQTDQKINYGTINLNEFFKILTPEILLNSFVGHNYLILFVQAPGTEPTKHAKIDIEKNSQIFQNNQIAILPMLTKTYSQQILEADLHYLKNYDLYELTTIFEKQALQSFKDCEFPVFISIDLKQQIVFDMMFGYRIGVAEQLFNIIQNQAKE